MNKFTIGTNVCFTIQDKQYTGVIVCYHDNNQYTVSCVDKDTMESLIIKISGDKISEIK